MSELKDCPFCGNAGIIRKDDDGISIVGCEGSNCIMEWTEYSANWYQTRKEAKIAWNKRAEES